MLALREAALPSPARMQTGTGAEARPAAPGRIIALDGLRGAAALLVVAAHYLGEVPGGIDGLTLGWVGVGVFFTLSGFLLGSVALEHRGAPNFVRVFLLRRTARILPVYAVVVGTTLIGLAALAGRPWVDAPLPPLAYATFTQNIAMATMGTTGSLWLVPTWTLAVEQQFYLLLPFAILAVPPARMPLLIGLGLLAGPAVRLGLILSGAGPLAGLVLLPAQADLLVAGIGAAWLARSGAAARLPLAALRAAPLGATLAILALAIGPSDAALAVLRPTLVALGAAGLILSLVRGAPEARTYRARWLCGAGTISYGLYLVHQPVAGWLHGMLLDRRPGLDTTGGCAVTALALALSVGLAALSWRWLEAPILRRAQAWRFEARRR